MANEIRTEAVIERAKARGFKSIVADVDPRSLALLAKLGFVLTREEKGNFQRGGEWLDSTYLAKTLE